MATKIKGSFFTVNFTDTQPEEALQALKDMLDTVYRVGRVSKRSALTDPAQDRRRTKAWFMLQNIKNGAGKLTFNFGTFEPSEATLSWNGTGSNPYRVTLDTGYVTCDCIDAERNERLCKHRIALIGAVHAAREEVATLLVGEYRREAGLRVEAARLQAEKDIEVFAQSAKEIG